MNTTDSTTATDASSSDSRISDAEQLTAAAISDDVFVMQGEVACHNSMPAIIGYQMGQIKKVAALEDYITNATAKLLGRKQSPRSVPLFESRHGAAYRNAH